MSSINLYSKNVKHFYKAFTYKNLPAFTASNHAKNGRKKEVGINQDKQTSQILKEADMGLEYNLDTMLTPEIDVIDLSGGQWQRLAIARGLYRANGLITLYKPAAAIDLLEKSRVVPAVSKAGEG